MASPRLILIALCAGLFSATFSDAARAEAMAEIPSIEVPVRFDSGVITERFDLFALRQSTQPTPRVIYSEIVGFSGAMWTRLHFRACTLAGSKAAGNQSILRLTSLEDGAVQELTAESLREWRMSSAYFNGDAVLVEIIAWPGTGDHRVALDRVSIGPRGLDVDRSICGTEDDRVPVNDKAIGRIVPTGCTAFLIPDAQGCFLSAGHCAEAFFGLEVVEFKVPLSDPDGSPNYASPSDQYPVDPASVQFSPLNPGDDWAYFGTFANSNTGLRPVEAQRAFLHLNSNTPPPDGSALAIAGYGTDLTPPEWNGVLQIEVGGYTGLNGTTITYDDLDTQPGNSGSPIVHLNLGKVIGIHTFGECDGALGVNGGTAITNAGLQTALSNPTGICAAPEFDEAISRAFTVSRDAVGITEAISRSFTVSRNRIEFTEAISRAFTVEWDPTLLVCDGDINNDGKTDTSDFVVLAGSFGTAVVAGTQGDLTGDGFVDAADFVILAANFGCGA